MYLSGKKLWDVLERCSDLFPAWHKEENQYWNSNTGEIVRNDGLMMHDGLYRPDGLPDPDGYGTSNTFSEYKSGTITFENLMDKRTETAPLRVTLDEGNNLADLATEDGNDSPLVDFFAVAVNR